MCCFNRLRRIRVPFPQRHPPPGDHDDRPGIFTYSLMEIFYYLLENIRRIFFGINSQVQHIKEPSNLPSGAVPAQESPLLQRHRPHRLRRGLPPGHLLRVRLQVAEVKLGLQQQEEGGVLRRRFCLRGRGRLRPEANRCGRSIFLLIESGKINSLSRPPPLPRARQGGGPPRPLCARRRHRAGVGRHAPRHPRRGAEGVPGGGAGGAGGLGLRGAGGRVRRRARVAQVLVRVRAQAVGSLGIQGSFLYSYTSCAAAQLQMCVRVYGTI